MARCECGAQIMQPARGRPRTKCLACSPRDRALKVKRKAAPRAPTKPETIPCLSCGEPVEQTPGKGRTALRHPECKARWRAARSRMQFAARGGTNGNPRRWTMGWRRTCGDPFVARGAPPRTCSRPCSEQWRSEQSAARLRRLDQMRAAA